MRYRVILILALIFGVVGRELEDVLHPFDRECPVSALRRFAKALKTEY